MTSSTLTPLAKASSWPPRSVSTSLATRWRQITTVPSAPLRCYSGWWETCWTSAKEGKRSLKPDCCLKMGYIVWYHSIVARIELIHVISCSGWVTIQCTVVSFREGNEKSYQLLRDSLDLYLTINPDNVQYLLLQARLYFHLGIWPEKVRRHKPDHFRIVKSINSYSASSISPHNIVH